MFTIKVLIPSSSIIYANVLAVYNSQRSAESEPMIEARASEGGFAIPLNAAELKNKKDRANLAGYLLDSNNYIRQMRWNNKDELTSGFHEGFRMEETEMLYAALIYVLGAGNVIKVPYKY